MQERIADFKAAGASVVAISSNPPDSSLTLTEKHNLQYEVLTDKDYDVARQFGIVYTLTDELDGVYQNFGVDLKALHEADKSELVLAATYVVDKEGIIKYAFLDVDYTKRAEPDDILAVLRNL